ncbi:hypothetical protein FCM35_KLT17041 [Carex littledalei]|uniref:Uncharacterized protein n=1 Tax=Carex littledalei TaxID=544730 RepID=A0A833VZ64_9POAL|nr:hypothetical protein FCM35_KLT17041 [Carex littledalei]
MQNNLLSPLPLTSITSPSPPLLLASTILKTSYPPPPPPPSRVFLFRSPPVLPLLIVSSPSPPPLTSFPFSSSTHLFTFLLLRLSPSQHPLFQQSVVLLLRHIHPRFPWALLTKTAYMDWMAMAVAPVEGKGGGEANRDKKEVWWTGFPHTKSEYLQRLHKASSFANLTARDGEKPRRKRFVARCQMRKEICQSLAMW